jgi:hypothetical protein
MRATDPVILPSGEHVYPCIRLRDQSYPGASLTVTYGLYRQVCSNGLFAFASIAAPTRIPHFKNRADILMHLGRVIEASAEHFVNIIKEVGRLQMVAIPDPVAVIEAMNLPKKTKDKALDAIANRLTRPEDNIKTAWGLYNFVNELDRLTARRGSLAYLDRDQNFTLPNAA